MKVAYLYDAVHPWEKGGAQKRVWELARRLADDHDVHLYGMHYWDGPAVMTKEGVTLHGVCEPRELYVDGRRSIPQALTFAASLVPPLLREDFDIIDCQEFPYFPCFVGKGHELLRDSTLVVTWYEVWDDYWHDYLGWKGVFGQAVERATVRLADTVVPISEYIASDLRAIGRTHGLEVVENGVDFDGLQDIPAADADWDLVYVGRLSEHKNVDLLLDAAAIASGRMDRELSCCIVGDGPERDRLEAHAKDVGVADQVDFLGFVEADDDVIGNIKAGSVFVLPSTREGFPNTILEANACGVPSIVVDHEENGSTAVVEDGVTGFITSVSAEAIADRVVDLLTDDDLLADLSTGAREFGWAHDWDVIVDDLEDVYSSAVQADG
ncbi:glycosyltransferase family 4 protein [Salinirussus salinus]|uniref:glycosyltransferase family 4 protein n=1 Tax=Salinirussus salinus TaxID=1198300 RepID=UPI0013576280|nr:glycosyltransferase family 4 protein [Salinirussus salinus]